MKSHQPVLLNEAIKLLDPRPGEFYFDGTAGYGGHAAAVLDRIGKGRAVLVDRDPAAVAYLNERLGDRASIYHATYLEAVNRLKESGEKPDLILLDLGVSSPQLENPDRGFSFQHDGPLDMRMDPTQKLTAADIVNHYSEPDMKRLLSEYGGERRAGRAARAIAGSRPITTTAKLAEVVRKAVGYSGRIDPATRTFQAIRIEVNRELEELEEGLELAIDWLNPGGRIAVISFHSLEDRIVKQAFKDPRLKVLTKKPLSGKEFDKSNPRSRSAKLRAAQKIKQKQEDK